MVGDHLMTVLFLKDRDASRALTTQHARNIERLAAEMSPEKAAAFKAKVSDYTDQWLAMAQDVFDKTPSAPDPAPAIQPRLARQRSSGGGYVGRTVTRAVVWNIVNSIFRVLR